MIEGEIKETVTETERIYEYTTICYSGVRANVTVKRPILSEEEYERRRKITEQELIRFVQGVIADGHDWNELVQSTAQRGKESDKI